MTETLNPTSNYTDDVSSSNVQNVTTTAQVAHIYNYTSLLLLPLSLAGLMGNLMVILAISQVKKLRSNTNHILASLAIADLLVCVIVMPLAMLQLITGIWQLGDVACSMYLFLDVGLCTSSILHMCTISFDRYLGIAYPLKYSNFRTKRATWLKIMGIWSLAVVLACPIFIHAYTDSESIYINGACAINNSFQIYGSTCAFYIPLLVMTVTYFLTIRKLNIASQMGSEPTLRRARGYSQRRQAHRTYSKDSSTSSVISNGSLRNAAANESVERSSGSSRRSISQASQCAWEREKLFTDINGNEKPEETNLAEKRKKFVGHKLSCTHCQTSMPLLKMTNSDTIPENEELKKVRYHSTSMRDTTQAGLGGMTSSVSYDTGKQQYRIWRLMRSKTNLAEMLAKLRTKKSFSSQMDKERKATQVLGLVFLAFVVSWTPFFVINIIQPFCQLKCQFSDQLMNFVLWLGYSASIANPIIYTIINKHFQKAFKDMLTCQLWIRKKKTHTLKTCFSNLNGHVMALATNHALPSTSN